MHEHPHILGASVHHYHAIVTHSPAERSVCAVAISFQVSQHRIKSILKKVSAYNRLQTHSSLCLVVGDLTLTWERFGSHSSPFQIGCCCTNTVDCDPHIAIALGGYCLYHHTEFNQLDVNCLYHVSQPSY